MNRKSFFDKRNVREMRDELVMNLVWETKGLVDRIYELEEDEGLVLQFPLIPPTFLGKQGKQAPESRKHYRWGEFLPIKQPGTLQEAYDCAPYIPLIGRMHAFDELRNRDEEEIECIGISWKPVQGRDRLMRVVPFDAIVEGVKIFAYSCNQGTGIEINKKYTDARVVQREGGQVICKVPSRTRKKGKYRMVLSHVPLVAGKEENAVVLSLRSNFIEEEPGRETFLHNLRYAYESGGGTSERVVFGPHEVAAYLATIKHDWKKLNATVPLRMNPFPLPSLNFFRYARKLDNQVAISDPTLESKDKLRNLHLDEKCRLLGWAIGIRGAWETAYWDPKRDGSLSKYGFEE